MNNNGGFCECNCGQPAPLSDKTDNRRGHVAGEPQHFISGHHRNHTKHGWSRTPEYTAFLGAKYRCTLPEHTSWKDYGGRGIKFLFTSFEQFLADIGPRPEGRSLDRIENDGNYEPGNVRWATKDEQMANQRPKMKAEKK